MLSRLINTSLIGLVLGACAMSSKTESDAGEDADGIDAAGAVIDAWVAQPDVYLDVGDAGIQLCTIGSPETCPSDYVCVQFLTCAGGTGGCNLRPENCQEIYDPVCGCDGVTYPTLCDAVGNGMSVRALGACP